MKYLLKDKNENVLFSHIDLGCKQCIMCADNNPILIDKCKLNLKKHKIAKKSNEFGSVFLCAESNDIIKSNRLFRAMLNLHLSFLRNMLQFKKEIEENINKKTKRLLHNLTSLNAHNIQEIYALVPQGLLTENLKKQFRHLESEINNNVNEAARMFLRIAKHNAAMKTEFSVFKKLYETSPQLNFKEHPIRKVILNVLHTFFQDFTDANVKVTVKDCKHKLRIDYESFHVVFYHLIDNAAKYIYPNTDLEISFSISSDYFQIIFSMTSIKIEEDEFIKIFEEGYSSRNARSLNKAGEGIGMYRVKKILSLNNALIGVECDPSINFQTSDGTEYARNQFVIEIPKKYICQTSG